jgi:hypothetical protein
MQTVAGKVAKLNSARDVKKVIYEVVRQTEGALFNDEEEGDPAFKAFFTGGVLMLKTTPARVTTRPRSKFLPMSPIRRRPQHVRATRFHPMDSRGICLSPGGQQGHVRSRAPIDRAKRTVKMRVTRPPIRAQNVAR